MTLLPDEVLFDSFAERLELTEGLMLSHVVLQMSAQVHLEKVAQVRDMVTRSCAHFGQPCVELVEAINTNHVIDVAQLFQVLAKSVHCLGQVCALLLDLLSRLDDLLIEDLVAVSEVSHASAENHRVLIHVDANVALLGYELHDRLAVLGLLEDFVCFEEIFVVLNLQEVIKTDARLEFLTASYRLQEARELLLPLSQELLSHLVRLEGQGRNQDVGERAFKIRRSV
eukprot:CAMPEP_0170461464 /NCGR_PEP_ID=MMETSP0123-20130129/7358_1 /TAXON_ID=182087 /ORGANISM="Favella ehrenbergii, Strain Fehren 1" /LENGTH=226 /DNA_ID=CAMNT_0010726487 /DNA_START=880 /DNA_END=1561 /DNA_ORIENTATION=-